MTYKHPLHLPVENKRVINDTIAFMEFGNETGIPMVMIHGNQGSAYSFAEIIPLLDSFRIIVLDLPGHGSGPPITDNFSKQHSLATKYCFDIIDYVNLNKYVLLGHSLGAMITLDMCISKRKDEILAAVLIDPFINMSERPSELFNLSPFEGASDEVIDKVNDAYDDGPGVEWHKYFDVSKRIPDITIPVLELQGEAFPGTDEVFNVFLSNHRRNVPNSWRIERVKRAAHFLHVERPEVTASIIRNFLEGIGIV